MYSPQLFKQQFQNGKTPPLDQVMQQLEDTANNANALLLVVDISVHELYQPLTVALGLSELLLAQSEPHSPQAEDLKIIVKEIRRMSEIVRGLKLLTHYQTTPDL